MGKTILITGSSRGIGAAIARSAKEEGYNVLLHGKTPSPELTALAKELDASYMAFDVSDEAAVQENLENKTIDVLVNNAGVNLSKPFLEQTIDDWNATYRTNVLGTINCTRAVAPQMQEKGWGRIVNIGSVKGYEHISGSMAYAMAKSGVRGITANLAKELAPITVNCVDPGFTETEMTKQTWNDRIAKEVDSIPLQRMAQPEEIAHAVLFLAGEKAGYITGVNLPVDGGFLIK